MMKCTLVLFFAIFCIWKVSTLPIADEDAKELDNQQLEHVRVKRFTCDVLSVEAKGVKLNHAACGVHCLFKGRTGGYCNGKRVCICR